MYKYRQAARHLWRRVPPHVRTNHPDIAAVWHLGQQLLIGDHATLFQSATSYEWEPLLALLNTKFLCTKTNVIYGNSLALSSSMHLHMYIIEYETKGVLVSLF